MKCLTVISFLVAISIPLFLFLSLFQILGASVNVLYFGFVKTLLVCIIATPFALMNLYSLKKIWT